MQALVVVVTAVLESIVPVVSCKDTTTAVFTLINTFELNLHAQRAGEMACNFRTSQKLATSRHMVSDELGRVLKNTICHQAYVRGSNHRNCPGLHWKYKGRLPGIHLGTHVKRDKVLKVKGRREVCCRHVEMVKELFAAALAVENRYLRVKGLGP